MTIFEFVTALNAKSRLYSQKRYRVVVEGPDDVVGLEHDKTPVASVRIGPKGIESILMNRSAEISVLRLIESIIPEGVTVK